MHRCVLAFFGGILLVQTWTTLWPALLAVPIVAVSVRRRWPVVFAVSAGVLWVALRAALLLADGLDPALEGESIIVTGVVTDFGAAGEWNTRFEFRIDSARTPGRVIDTPERVRLAWYDWDGRVQPGERWQLSVRLRRPWSLRNPGSFDSERQLFSRGIRATGYVVTSSYNERLSTPIPWTLAGLRAGLFRQLEVLFSRTQNAGILTALILGKRDGISDHDWTLLRDSGTAHLMSISGLHVSLAAFCGFLFGRGLWTLFPSLMLRVPAQTAGWMAGLLVAVVYAGLAGFSLPTTRAVIMLGAAVVQRLRGRYVVGSDTLCMALSAVLLLQPLSVLDTGFWFSFAAVALIFWMLGGRTGAVALPVRLCRIHLALGLGLAPLAALAYQQNPLLGPLANLFAVPFVSFVIFPLLLLAVAVSFVHLPVAGWLIGWVDAALSYLLSFLARIAAFGFATLDVAASGPMLAGCAAVGAMLLLMPRGLPLRWLGVIWLLPLLAGGPKLPAPGHADVHVLDVGQGLAAIVRTSKHTLLIDAGANLRGFVAAEQAVIPVLRQLRIRRLDRVIISHADNDHAGGLTFIAENFDIGDVLHSGLPALPVAGRACRAGERWTWDGVRFLLLHPGDEVFADDNNASCVLRIETAGAAALFPGDIEAAAEARLLQASPELLRAALLLAPHHGSRTSSTPAFVAAVAPESVVFTAGYRNRYGLPHPAVVERYVESGASVHTTYAGGALTFHVGREVAARGAWRRDRLRYWHSR